MANIEDTLAQFPLTEEFKGNLHKKVRDVHVRVLLVSNIIDLLTKTPVTLEEAAMLFNQAKSLAHLFKETSEPEKKKP